MKPWEGLLRAPYRFFNQAAPKARASGEQGTLAHALRVRLWLQADYSAMSEVCPLYPRKPTFKPYVRFRIDFVRFAFRGRPRQ